MNTAPVVHVPGEPGAARPSLAWWRRHENTLWAIVLVAVVAWRWPLLKGYYYRFANVPAPPSAIVWRTDLASALSEAQNSGRPLLVDVAADWCPPCQAMKHDVWPDAEVGRVVMAGFVPVTIDADHDGGFSARYQVDSIPTLLVLDAAGRVVRRAGYLPRSGMLRFLAGQ